ncbi:hypothetical protein JOD43_002730 [Pullulanibacillus pueri]|uniref:Phr family secreted Rap phosphatase inhibitor n=1 Tax=Pullulanibacillus pueri TaxID=1437324 RepID=A0A8J3EM42_9BACL|nr:hypothetical protein [Pullulanibacillus pueri]MBM7682552.1 hypothetical protein [Pullulanibacillus pueri]GGH81953.1 hypothetical protein GCM10007096_20610 [Pullulanibacillus pueri]
MKKLKIALVTLALAAVFGLVSHSSFNFSNHDHPGQADSREGGYPTPSSYKTIPEDLPE